jgi:hypothetical protein
MRIVAVELAKCDVMAVDHRAGRDVLAGEADDGVVFEDRVALAQMGGGDLVAGRHLAARHYVLLGHRRAGRHVHPRDDHVVARMQADHGAGHALLREVDHCSAHPVLRTVGLYAQTQAAARP